MFYSPEFLATIGAILFAGGGYLLNTPGNIGPTRFFAFATLGSTLLALVFFLSAWKTCSGPNGASNCDLGPSGVAVFFLGFSVFLALLAYGAALRDFLRQERRKSSRTVVIVGLLPLLAPILLLDVHWLLGSRIYLSLVTVSILDDVERRLLDVIGAGVTITGALAPLLFALYVVFFLKRPSEPEQTERTI